MALLHAAGAAVTTHGGPWIIGGDWNMEPAALESSGWLRVVDGVVVATHLPTCFSFSSRSGQALFRCPGFLQ